MFTHLKKKLFTEVNRNRPRVFWTVQKSFDSSLKIVSLTSGPSKAEIDGRDRVASLTSELSKAEMDSRNRETS